jgi:3-(3-hydroxy-phenyl)propionate hydroxylase
MLRPITPLLGPGLHGSAPAPAAARAAQPRLPDGTRLDDRIGYNFAIIATPQLAAKLPDATFDDIDVVLAEGETATYLAGLKTEAVVIRPDRHILGIASTPAELEAVLSRRPRLAHTASSRRTTKAAVAN